MSQQLDNFNKIIDEFLADLINTFPDKIQKNYLQIYSKNVIYEFCKEVYPKKFFDILYENEEIFKSNEKFELLPEIDFIELWNENISENTKCTVWKYLQLILFSITPDINSEESFGDTAKLFEAINQDEFKNKISETMDEIDKIFNKDNFKNEDKDNNEENKKEDNYEKPNIPNAEELHNHINKMMEGKLGSLAKEIAEETAKDLELDIENSTNLNDVFKQLFKNPAKLMGLVKNVGSKLDTKIKNGDIKESELLEEASDLVNNMKNMPGMENLENMFSKMGIPGMGKGAKVDINSLNNQMQKNLRLAKMRDRMRSKINQSTEKNNETDNLKNNQTFLENNKNDIELNKKKQELIKSLGINLEGIEEFIFSTGENVDKSNRNPTNRKKKKGKKNK